MECNKEEAIRAMNIAERKLSDEDYLGAKKFMKKAQNLYPNLDGLKQALMMIDVYISASNKIMGGGEYDWYGILGVDPLADEETVKKQYKNLALLLHPDKNKFNGAEEAFKLVSNACELLSDKLKRSAYDQKRKSKEVKQNSGMQQKQQKPHEEPAEESARDVEERRRNWNMWLEESRKKFAADVDRGNKNEAERVSKKQMKRKMRRKNSSFEAEKLFKKPMANQS